MQLENICKEIENGYEVLNHSLGWRFINSSQNTIKENSGICMITLNPAGNKYERNICSLENDKNAYLDENWENRGIGKDKLQIQIQYMFSEIHKRMNKYNNYEELMRNSFMAHFIPFRSPTLEKLHNKNLSIEFSKNIWQKIFYSSEFNFSTIICIGKDQFDLINEIFNEKYTYIKSKELKTGWGEYKSIINNYSYDDRTIKIVYLQHLSRFSIFNRKNGEGKVEIKRLFDYIMK